MRKSIITFLPLILFGILFFITPQVSHAAKEKKGEKPDNGFTGSITAVDTTAKTIKIDADGGKTILIDSTTSIIKAAGGVLKLADLKVGDAVHVSTVNLANQLTAVTVKVGVKLDATPAKKKKKKTDS